jgi:hypothetical protein
MTPETVQIGVANEEDYQNEHNNSGQQRKPKLKPKHCRQRARATA